MNDYLRYILFELQNSLGLVMLAGILAITVITIVYLVFKKNMVRKRSSPGESSCCL